MIKWKAGYKSPIGWPGGGTVFLDREEAESVMKLLDEHMNSKKGTCDEDD